MSTFRLPDLGEGLAEAEIVEWHVKVGDHVRVDQPMVSVETAKAVVEVPAPFSGVVTALRGGPGDIVLTGAPLIEFDSGTVVGSMPATSEEEYVELSLRWRSAQAEVAARACAVPAARALAKRLGVDLAAVQGSGRAGLITLDDVLQHADMSIAPGGAPASPAARAIAAAAPGDGTVEPLRGVRRAMAQSMSLSRDQVPGSTVCDDADIHHWTQARRLHAAADARDGLCLARGTRLERLVRSDRAIAAAGRAHRSRHRRGYPRRTHRAGGAQRREEIARRTARGHRSAKGGAHRRSTQPEDLRDFTLMLSNFGTLAGRYGIPLVVPPAVAILGAGKVREDAVVVAGAVQAHRRMPLH